MAVLIDYHHRRRRDGSPFTVHVEPSSPGHFPTSQTEGFGLFPTAHHRRLIAHCTHRGPALALRTDGTQKRTRRVPHTVRTAGGPPRPLDARRATTCRPARRCDLISGLFWTFEVASPARRGICTRTVSSSVLRPVRYNTEERDGLGRTREIFGSPDGHHGRELRRRSSNNCLEELTVGSVEVVGRLHADPRDRRYRYAICTLPPTPDRRRASISKVVVRPRGAA